MNRLLTLQALYGLGLSMSFMIACHPAVVSPLQHGNWVAAAAIGSYPRSGASSFVIGNTAYVGLGFSMSIPDRHRLRDFWSFNQNGWTQLEDFPGAPRSNAAAFSVGNAGYIGTGFDDYTIYQDFYRYDTVSHHWVQKTSFPDARYDAVGFAVKGKGYIGTGYSSYWLNDFYQYDTTTDSWTRTPGTAGDLSKRRGAVAFTYKDQAYIVTGSTSGGMARDFWMFDPSLPTPWTQLYNITNTDPRTFDDSYTDIQREYATAFVNGDAAFLVLGRNGSMLTSTWRYDFQTQTWQRRTAYPRNARYSAVGFTINGLSYVGTGNGGSNTTYDDFDNFQPEQPYNPND